MFRTARVVLKELKRERKALRTILRRRAYISPERERQIVENFHRLYYDSHLFGKTWVDTSWLGVPTQKCPMDMWVYQEIIHDLRPDVIVECGTLHGGSALFLASMCGLVGNGRVVTIDVGIKEERPAHDRITYLHGSTTDAEVVERVRGMIGEGETVLVLLDSDHARDHVLSEMRAYGPMVTRASYLIVEDTCVNGHPVLPEHGPGPMEAVEAYMQEAKDFVVDRTMEKHYLTFNPKGYLRKV